jgi:enolase
MQIQKILAREILDSRGQPTVEADVILDSGVLGRASVPSGASTGLFEALEWRDQDKQRYQGKGVLGAVEHIQSHIQKSLVGLSVENQRVIDERMIELDGTEDKSNFGANAILAVSLACARARAQTMEKPLFMCLTDNQTYSMPVPMLNILNGGAHANNSLDIQEFMVMPIGAGDFQQALLMSHAIIHELKRLLQQKGLSTAVGDEGGFAPNLESHEQALDFIMEAIGRAGLKAGQDVYLALDVASSEWFNHGVYQLPKSGSQYSVAELICYYQQLVNDYPIISIEDGLAETDWQGWQQLTSTLGHAIQLVGDDLFVTNPKRFQEGIDLGVANAILIKLNQIGTLTETLDTMQLAKTHGYRAVVSHRSGETADSFIADLAVASACGQIKTGSLCRSDRVEKYNQLLRIAETKTIPYAGRMLFQSLTR